MSSLDTGPRASASRRAPCMRSMPTQGMAMQSMASSGPDILTRSSAVPTSHAPSSGTLALGHSSASKKLSAPLKKRKMAGGSIDFASFGGNSNNNASSAGMPTPPPPAGKRGPLHDLIGLQTFVGAWDWNDELFEIIGKEVTFDAEAFASEQLMATALAVAFLESKLAASKDVWEMVVAKAKSWMASQGIVDVERAVDVARGLL